MKVLVTGASGFLGRHVVARLCARGHEVRALVRPASQLPAPLFPLIQAPSVNSLNSASSESAPDGAGLGEPPPAGRDARGGPSIEVVRADLRTAADLTAAFDGVDALIHLAAGVGIDEDSMFACTVEGTERLLEAMARTPVRRLVFASSFVVYDWALAHGTLDEDTPLAADIYQRGPYDVTKLWQERVVQRQTKAHGFELTVLRPGFVWGRGRAAIAGMGRVVGPLRLLIGPTSRLPLTHVENCADCFVTALERPASIGQVLNVIDSDDVRVWRYMHEYARGTGHRGLAVPIPYRLAMGFAQLASFTSRQLFGPRGKLPSIFCAPKFEAQFKPLRFSNRKLRNVLGWQPPLRFDECVARTYGPS